MVKTETRRKTLEKKYSDKELLGRFWRYLTAHKVQLIFIIISILAISGISILPPMMVERAYGILEDGGIWTDVYKFAIYYVVLSILLWIVTIKM